MKVPKKIKDLIKQIEKMGYDLAQIEKELYDWIESKEIDVSGEIDQFLEFLFYNHDGEDLIEYLENKE